MRPEITWMGSCLDSEDSEQLLFIGSYFMEGVDSVAAGD